MNTPAETLRATPLAKGYAESFTAATGLSLSIHEPGKFCLPEGHEIPPFCRLMALRSGVCARCVEMHVNLQDKRHPRTERCFAGLTSSAIPVVVQEKPVAYLHTGHAALGPETARTREGTPQISSHSYEGALRLLEFFSSQLAQSLPASPDGSLYPAVDRVALQIREHPEKSWNLNEMAHSTGMHPTYLSEMFHRRLGITFTDYLANSRAEKARRLLSFTNLRITEVAFESGFGSISQFNRVFRRLVGMSPGDFRKSSAASAK